MPSSSWIDLLSPIQTAGVSEAIVRRLGELVASGTIGSGERLPSEVELAEKFQVAPMTVRAALQGLREAEIVETKRGRYAGTYVSENAMTAIAQRSVSGPTLEEFKDFTTWRTAISGQASVMAAENVSEPTAEKLLSLHAETDHRTHTPQTYRLADASLHLFIAEMSGSNLLLEAEVQIQAKLTDWLQYTPSSPDLEVFPLSAHQTLVTSIVNGDAAAARESLQSHASATLDAMIGLGFIRNH